MFVKNRKRLHPTGKPVGFRLRCAKVYFITAIEYGNNLADICREKFKDYNGFEVITSKFEDVELEDNAYDLIYSASAFHWIPEEIGYTKVFKALKPGGVFARFANHPFRCKNEPELASAIDASYKKYYYKFYMNLNMYQILNLH